MVQCINRWLSVRLELLGISVVFGTAVLVAVAAPSSGGLAGLALTSALSLTGWVERGVGCLVTAGAESRAGAEEVGLGRHSLD